MDELVDLVEAAILGSARAFESEVPGGRIAGYALVVDGGFQSVYGACASHEFVDDEGDESVLFMPFDWDHEEHSTAFERASESLEAAVKSLGEASYDDRARAVSAALGEALAQAQKGHPGLRDAFLILVSAGGGESWQVHEGEWVERLNGSEAFGRWKAEFG